MTGPNIAFRFDVGFAELLRESERPATAATTMVFPYRRDRQRGSPIGHHTDR